VPVAGGGGTKNCSTVVPVEASEVTTEGTGDTPLSLSEEETTETSDVTSSPLLGPPTRWARLRELPGGVNVKDMSPPKLESEASLEGVEASGTCNASYMATTMREGQYSKNLKTYL
jgi:hypothetical protein